MTSFITVSEYSNLWPIKTHLNLTPSCYMDEDLTSNRLSKFWNSSILAWNPSARAPPGTGKQNVILYKPGFSEGLGLGYCLKLFKTHTDMILVWYLRPKRYFFDTKVWLNKYVSTKKIKIIKIIMTGGFFCWPVLTVSHWFTCPLDQSALTPHCFTN